MAKIKYSALVSDMRNKLNGSVMSANRYGSYVRNKVTPSNPQTVEQQDARFMFGDLSAAWRGLTQPQRESWIEGAKNFPFTDIFGDTKTLSGQSLFIKLNSNLEKIGQPRILTAPLPGNTPPLPFADLGAAQGVTYSSGSIQIGYGFQEEPAGYTQVVYVTDPVPAGINFVKNRFRLFGTAGEAGLDAITVVPLKGSYLERFGQPQTGSRIFARTAWINNATGEQSAPVELVGTV